MTNKETLMNYMDKLSEDELAVLLRTAYAMLGNRLITTKPDCPYCGSESIIRYGKKLGFSHQTAFNMRHKVLIALRELPDVKDILLGDVSEFDETFVLDCYKGKKLGDAANREPRKHGAKAQKRGISSEYLCICTGIQRKGVVVHI